MSHIDYHTYKLIEDGKISLTALNRDQLDHLEKALWLQRGSVTWSIVAKEPPCKITHMAPKKLDEMLRKEYGDKLPPARCKLSERDLIRRTTSIMAENWQGKGSETFYRRGRRLR